MDQFTGCGVALVTPFTPKGEVDLAALQAHVNNMISLGVDYLVVLGTTAETPTLDPAEKQEILDSVAAAADGRVPLMAGMGGNDTRGVIRSLEKTGLDAYQAILSVSPYYNKPTQEGIYQHFSSLAAVSELPILLYNVPGRTGSNMEAKTTLRLANDHPESIFGIKEASGDMEQAGMIAEKSPEGFLLLSGDDASAVEMISLGAKGLISVAANALPELISRMIRTALEGEMKDASSIHASLEALNRALFEEGNPAGIKAAMNARGWSEQVLRLPLVGASAGLQEKISRLVRELGY